VKSLSPWVFVTAPGILLGGVLLSFTIRSLIRLLRASVVAAVPLAPEQRISFETPGPYDLYGQGSFGSSTFYGLDFELVDRAGQPVPLEKVFFRTQVRSFSSVKLLLRSFTIPRADTYTLRVRGDVRPSASDGLVIAHPIRAPLIGHILGIVFLGMVTIGSLVATALLVLLPLQGPR